MGFPTTPHPLVTPAKAGALLPPSCLLPMWIENHGESLVPAFAGMTRLEVHGLAGEYA